MSATKFGQRLRHYRQRRIDPATDSSNSGSGSLTQAQFGGLVGRKLGLLNGSYSGAAVSEWELGKSAISAHDRPLLLAIVAVLSAHQRMINPAEANDLLQAGGYSALDANERRELFPDMPDDDPPSPARETEIVFRLGAGLERWREYFKRPPANWLDGVWDALGRWFTSQPPAQAMVLAGWAAAWWATWTWLFPVMAFRAESGAALVWPDALAHLAVSSACPLLIAVLMRPWQGDAWANLPQRRRHALAFAAQGALIGYQTGAWLLFIVALVIFHTTRGQGSLRWIEWALAAIPLSMAAWGARRLTEIARPFSPREHGIFFTCGFMSAIWIGLFLYTYPLLIDLTWGLWVLIGAGFGVGTLSALAQRFTGNTVLPLPMWIGLYGVIAVAYEWQSTSDLVTVIVLAGLIITLALTAAWGPLYAPLVGAMGFALSAAGLLVLMYWNLTAGRVAAVLWLAFWWMLGRRWFRLPLAFWIVAGSAALVEWAAGVRPDLLLPLVVGYVLAMSLALIAEYRLRVRG